MAEQDIIEGLIGARGQSQGDRSARGLAADFVLVDERTPKDLLLFASSLAERIHFYGRRDGGAAAGDGTWKPFFDLEESAANAILASTDGVVTPHLALLAVFALLHEMPRRAINGLTKRHLDFYYREVLRFTKRPAAPDRAHVVVELKKYAPPIRLGSGDLFTAGKGPAGVELLYSPVRDTVVGPATVDQPRSVFLDGRDNERVRIATVTNSLDGLGTPLGAGDQSWPAFGSPGLPEARIGFALASPVLRLREGRRTIVLSLVLSNAQAIAVDAGALAGALTVLLTGEEQWLGPFAPAVRLEGNTLTLRAEIPETAPAIADHRPEVHGTGYAAKAPVAQVLLGGGRSAIGYRQLKRLEVRAARVVVEAAGIKGLALENDEGTLNPAKPFLPFGAEPTVGSRLLIGCPEAFSKKLSELSLEVVWKGVPPSFAVHYSNYGVAGIDQKYFTASLLFHDGGGWRQSSSNVLLFAPDGAARVGFTFRTSDAATPATAAGKQIYALMHSGGVWAEAAAERHLKQTPMRRADAEAQPEPPEKFAAIALNRDFLHSTYRARLLPAALAIPPLQLKEPYTPAVQELSLAYKAYSNTVNLASASLDDYSDLDVMFFHIGCFGQRREHRYQREQFPFVTQKTPSLLPVHDDAGELLVGIPGLGPWDGVSLLIQVADGTAEPDLAPEEVRWSALCNDYWRPLDGQEAVLDLTGGLRRSGTVAVVVPADATTRNGMLPSGRVWLKAAVARNPESACRLVAVVANGIELQPAGGAEPSSSEPMAPLGPGRIGRLKTARPEVKTVAQPYAAFGGRRAEDDKAFYARVAERLRHKQRCITAWDYERMVLEAFPSVQAVKCVPHAGLGSWLAPGHVLVVVVPRLADRTSIDPLKPRLDAGTIDEIAQFLQGHAGEQVRIKVQNPQFQKVHLTFEVKFFPGHSPSFFTNLLQKEIVRTLSPWVDDPGQKITFGNELIKSDLIKRVEMLEYVDYVTNFRMFSDTAGGPAPVDLAVARPIAPDTILVSDAIHNIAAIS